MGDTHAHTVISALPKVKLGAERRDASQLLWVLKRTSAVGCSRSQMIDVFKKTENERRGQQSKKKKYIYIRNKSEVKQFLLLYNSMSSKSYPSSSQLYDSGQSMMLNISTTPQVSCVFSQFNDLTFTIII